MLIDKKLKPWLIEVNVLPSLSSSSPFDKSIKTMLICDLLNLVGVRGYDKKKVHTSTNQERKLLSKRELGILILNIEEQRTYTLE